MTALLGDFPALQFFLQRLVMLSQCSHLSILVFFELANYKNLSEMWVKHNATYLHYIHTNTHAQRQPHLYNNHAEHPALQTTYALTASVRKFFTAQ